MCGDASTPPGGHDETEVPPSALTGAETAALSALVEGLFPRDELGPGALDIGVVDYLTRAFHGPYREFVPLYRLALAALDQAAGRDYGQTFADLAPEARDVLIGRLERGQLDELHGAELAPFFPIAWQHLREGLFGDPMHGGNRGMLGWRLIGFPGAQYGYTPEEQQVDAVIAREPRSAAQLPADGTESRVP